MLINVLFLKEQCQKFIKENPGLKISKVVEKKGDFVFYRVYKNINTKIDYETADFRIVLVRNENKEEGWSIEYMRYTGRWTALPIFGDFEYCLDEIENGSWDVLKPLK